MTCADALQPSVTRGSTTHGTSGSFLELPTTAIRSTFLPIGTFVTGKNLCIHSSYCFAELHESIRNTFCRAAPNLYLSLEGFLFNFDHQSY